MSESAEQSVALQMPKISDISTKKKRAVNTYCVTEPRRDITFVGKLIIDSGNINLSSN